MHTLLDGLTCDAGGSMPCHYANRTSDVWRRSCVKFKAHFGTHICAHIFKVSTSTNAHAYTFMRPVCVVLDADAE